MLDLSLLLHYRSYISFEKAKYHFCVDAVCCETVVLDFKLDITQVHILQVFL